VRGEAGGSHGGSTSCGIHMWGGNDGREVRQTFVDMFADISGVTRGRGEGKCHRGNEEGTLIP
jgi:hypothetical protein